MKRDRSKLCKWLSHNILVCGKWDILDTKMRCVSGSAAALPRPLPPPSPIPLMKNSEVSLKKIISKKSGENYQEIIPQIEKTVEKKP